MKLVHPGLTVRGDRLPPQGCTGAAEALGQGQGRWQHALAGCAGCASQPAQQSLELCTPPPAAVLQAFLPVRQKVCYQSIWRCAVNLAVKILHHAERTILGMACRQGTSSGDAV